MDKTAYIQFVVTAQAIGINNTVRHDFLFANSHQSIRLGIIYGNSLDPSVAFQKYRRQQLSLPHCDRPRGVPRNNFRPTRQGPQKPHRQPKPNDG